MTPPSVQFIPAPTASFGNLIATNAIIRTSVAGVEQRVETDLSTNVYNGWTFRYMDFRDSVKNGVWTDDGLGLLWNMLDSTNYARWQNYIGTGPGIFSVYYTGTSNLVFSLAWSGEQQWTTNVRRYGVTAVNFEGLVVAQGTRVDVYHN